MKFYKVLYKPIFIIISYFYRTQYIDKKDEMIRLFFSYPTSSFPISYVIDTETFQSNNRMVDWILQKLV